MVCWLLMLLLLHYPTPFLLWQAHNPRMSQSTRMASLSTNLGPYYYMYMYIHIRTHAHAHTVPMLTRPHTLAGYLPVSTVLPDWVGGEANGEKDQIYKKKVQDHKKYSWVHTIPPHLSPGTGQSNSENNHRMEIYGFVNYRREEQRQIPLTWPTSAREKNGEVPSLTFGDGSPKSS